MRFRARAITKARSSDMSRTKVTVFPAQSSLKRREKNNASPWKAAVNDSAPLVKTYVFLRYVTKCARRTSANWRLQRNNLTATTSLKAGQSGCLQKFGFTTSQQAPVQYPRGNASTSTSIILEKKVEKHRMRVSRTCI